jgi:hypothetical protein
MELDSGVEIRITSLTGINRMWLMNSAELVNIMAEMNNAPDI